MSYYDHASENALERQRLLIPRRLKTWEREKNEAERRSAERTGNQDKTADRENSCPGKNTSNSGSNITPRRKL